MTILPGLTSTRSDLIPTFVRDLRESAVRRIALFPTVLTRPERDELYHDLAAIDGLIIPHVHLRSDCDEAEMRFLVQTFSTEVFNIHPAASRHPFGPVPEAFANRIFVENVDVAIDESDLRNVGGICPDYSHLENARLQGLTEYVERTTRQLRRYPIGCCHVSGIRIGDPNEWSGGWDHHNTTSRADLDYMARYADVLPDRWISLELENSLAAQLEASRYLARMLSAASPVATGVRPAAD